MADELAEKIAEAKKKMLGDLQPLSGAVLYFSGDVRVDSPDRKVQIRKVPS